MTHRLAVPAVALLAAVLGATGCSSGTKAATSTPSSASTSAAQASSAPVSSSSAAPASPSATSPTAQPVAGGAATDFCSAFKEYRTSVEAATPEAVGAGFRAASVDARKYAPVEIKAAVGLFADVLDEVGQAIAAGKPNPEVLGKGQSAPRRQALADTITWVNKNCHL